MNGMKKTLVWMRRVLLCAILFFLCACKNDTEAAGEVTERKKEGAAMLNDRQKEILQKEGLPVEYEQLTLMQKAAIEAIETMLLYLESTYGQEFSYAGYVAKNGVEEEHLMAECSLGLVTLYRRNNNGEWEYEDDYDEIRAMPEYKALVESFVAGKLPTKSYKIFVRVGYMTDRVQTTFSGASATTYVFVDEGVGKGAFDAFVSDYTAWLTESADGVPTGAKLFLTERGKLSEIHEFNLEEMSITKIYSKKVNYSISERGEVTINERNR